MRSVFVQRKVLELYQDMDSVSYPIQPELLLQCIPKSCRILSYQEMAEVTGCTFQDVAVEMNAGRIRWTLAHEIGHIYIGHLEVIEGAEIAYNEQRGFYDQFESEADYFAWNLLAPLPILREMGIRSASEIKATYGLSNQAAALQFDRYTKWCRGHVKTAWENGMLRIFRNKYMA